MELKTCKEKYVLSDQELQSLSERNISLLSAKSECETQNAKLCDHITQLQTRLREKNDFILALDERIAQHIHMCPGSKFRADSADSSPKLTTVSSISYANAVKNPRPSVPVSMDKVKAVTNENMNTPYGKSCEYVPTNNAANQKKSVLIIGNSHIDSLNPDRMSNQNSVHKETAYTIDEASSSLNNLNIRTTPDCIVYHLITNDVKRMEVENCVN